MDTSHPDAPPTVPKLSVRRPGQPREEFELSKSPIMVGRIKTNDIVLLDDTSVSREHCCFEIDPARHDLSVRDLGSSNGTFVNGKAVSQTPSVLKPGDQIQVGATLMIFSVDRPSAGALVRRLKPHGQNLPWPPREGEKDRTTFGDDFCICGRCGERIHLRKMLPGEKIGCVRCRAVWHAPSVSAGARQAEMEVTQALSVGHEMATETKPISIDDAKKATNIIREPTSSTSLPPFSPDEPADTGEETTERPPPAV